MKSKLNTTIIQHWLNTPRGAYYGYPNYGNAFEALIYQNKNDSQQVLDAIMDMMIDDIGLAEASHIQAIELASPVGEPDKFVVIIVLDDGSLGGFKVIGDRT